MTSRLFVRISLFVLATAVFLPRNAFAWNLQGSCVGNPLTAHVGDVINWTATQTSTLQSPSQGHYEWVWNGTDELSDTTQSVSKTYATPGVKTATVRIKLVLVNNNTESITRTCSVTITVLPPATLKVIKQVVNDDGGTKTPADFTMRVKDGATDVAGSPFPGSGTGTTYTLPPGTYTVGENAVPAGYTQTGISGDCAPNGSVTLASGDSKTCTVMNDDTPPAQFGGACAVTPSTGGTDTLFAWSASAFEGTGSYTYLWSGNESLSGTSGTIIKSYSSAGTKTGTVIITSGSQSITKQCTVMVTVADTPFDGVCSVSPATAFTGEVITWSGSASGGTGMYAYSWSGDGNLSGDTATVSNTYSSAGTKLGAVSITSGSNSIDRTCSVFIKPRACETGCGGGFNQPNVVLFKKATTSSLTSASIYLSQVPYSFTPTSSSVYLSQIPYTGVVADTLNAVVYIVILLALSGFITYLFFRRRNGDRRLFKDPVHLTNITSAPRAVKRNDSAVMENNMPEFISWLVSDDSQKVFDYLRSLKHQDKDLSKFVTDIANELDLVYRNRIDAHATVPSEQIKKAVEGWSNKKLENAISVLVGSVDESYHSNETAIKLAMAKIMKMWP